MTEPDDPQRPAPDIPKRLLWHRIGYILSAIWVGGVLYVTDGNVRHPLFNYIFIVPLVGWVVGLLIARLLGRRKRMPPQV